MLRIQFVEPVQPLAHWPRLKPRFVEAVETAKVKLGPCAELLDLITFHGYTENQTSSSVFVDMKLAYQFDGRIESIIPVAEFSVNKVRRAFWQGISQEIVGKTALAVHEITLAHRRTSTTLQDLLASAPHVNGAAIKHFSCPRCSHAMRLFGTILICQCGATKSW